MIEENKVWKHFSGYKNIEANPDNFVVILYEGKDGWHYLDAVACFNGKWKSYRHIPEKQVIGYYEVDSIVKCRVKYGCPIDSIPSDFKGNAWVVWEYEGCTDGRSECFKMSDVVNSRVRYTLDHFGMVAPDYVIGYHLLPDNYFVKFDDGAVKETNYNLYKNEEPKKKSKLTITIKRNYDDTHKVIVTRNGERKSYSIDAPEVKEYSDLIQFQLKLMKSTNTGSSKVSFSE